MSDVEVEAPSDDYITVLKGMKYSARMNLAGPIAKPLADKGLKKKISKLMKKARAQKLVACGIKDCIKQIYKKKNEGIVVMAGDVSPVDTITHLHGICYANGIPYCYVATRFDLGESFASNINASCICIRPHESYREQYDAVVQEIKELEC
nr:H:ACA ribonucleoprotein complex subunit 2 [Hymenolepis microstoma]